VAIYKVGKNGWRCGLNGNIYKGKGAKAKAIAESKDGDSKEGSDSRSQAVCSRA